MNLKYNNVDKLEPNKTENKLFNNLLQDYNYNLKHAKRLQVELSQQAHILQAIEYEYAPDLTESEKNAIMQRENEERAAYRQLHTQVQECFKLNLRQTKQLAELIEKFELTAGTTEDDSTGI